MVIVLVVFICIVFLKAYAIGIVWRCYKYLTLRQQNLRTLLPCVMPELGGAGLVGEERAYTTLLPNYDEAIAQYLKQAPPPSYQVAMSNYQRVDAEVDAANNVVAAGAAVVTVDDAMDNNNDTPNNNNTVHVNANTPPMRRNESSGGGGGAEDIETAAIESDNAGVTATVAPVAVTGVERASGELTPPPPYINGVVRVTGGNGESRIDNRNESQA